MNSNHVLGTSWGPIEYRETGLYGIDRKLTSLDVDTSMSCFGDFNHMNMLHMMKLILIISCQFNSINVKVKPHVFMM